MFCCFLVSSVVEAALPLSVKIPEGGTELLASDASSGAYPVLPKTAGIATAKPLQASDAPCAKTWAFDIVKMPANSWDVQLSARLLPSAVIKQGDKCLLLFFARSLGKSQAVGAANVEMRVPPDYKKLGRTEFKVATAWEQVIMPFTAAATLLDGKGSATVPIGGAVQGIELGGLRLLDYGQDFDFAKLPHPNVSYEGREPDASWRKEALKRIDKLRKGTLNLEVTDAAGKPVPGAEVHAVLKRHAFGFGSAVTAKMLVDPSSDGDKYRAVVDECFSKVVMENDLKTFAWDTYTNPKQEGGYRKAWLDQSLAWLNEHHIPVRGHYLCWGPFEPWSEKLKNNPQAIREKVLSHMRDITPAVGGRVSEWDALNHPVAWEKGICIDSVLGSEFYAEVFNEARKLTKLPLWINEDQVFREGRQQEEYFQIIQKLIASGVKIDGIGNQSHFHSSFLPSPDEMLKNSDRFAALVPALQLTEFDVNTDGDDQLAADFTHDLLIACFSHPAYTGFVMWGFWEGAHWKPATALWKKDWTEKPAAKVWKEWVCGKWKTDVTVKSDAQGRADVAGFFGRYEVTVIKDGKTARQEAMLERGGSQLNVRLQ